jgi:hypothetical protein
MMGPTPWQRGLLSGDVAGYDSSDQMTRPRQYLPEVGGGMHQHYAMRVLLLGSASFGPWPRLLSHCEPQCAHD